MAKTATTKQTPADSAPASDGATAKPDDTQTVVTDTDPAPVAVVPAPTDPAPVTDVSDPAEVITVALPKVGGSFIVQPDGALLRRDDTDPDAPITTAPQ